jgi:hypothetical protein
MARLALPGGAMRAGKGQTSRGCEPRVGHPGTSAFEGCYERKSTHCPAL